MPEEMANEPERLIDEYDVREWMSHSYTGSDIGRKCISDRLPKRARGLVRMVPTSQDGGDNDESDSKDKED